MEREENNIDFYNKLIFVVSILINIIYYITRFLVSILINIIYYNLKYKEKINKQLKTKITLLQLNNIKDILEYIEKTLDNSKEFNLIESKSRIFNCFSEKFYLNLNKETLQNIKVYIKENNFKTLGDYNNLQNKIKEEQLKNIDLNKNIFLYLIKN